MNVPLVKLLLFLEVQKYLHQIHVQKKIILNIVKVLDTSLDPLEIPSLGNYKLLLLIINTIIVNSFYFITIIHFVFENNKKKFFFFFFF